MPVSKEMECSYIAPLSGDSEKAGGRTPGRIASPTHRFRDALLQSIRGQSTVKLA